MEGAPYSGSDPSLKKMIIPAATVQNIYTHATVVPLHLPLPLESPHRVVGEWIAQSARWLSCKDKMALVNDLLEEIPEFWISLAWVLGEKVCWRPSGKCGINLSR
jgi:hypothetical protein